MPARTGPLLPVTLLILLVSITSFATAGTGVHTTYLWHMHQPIYGSDQSIWNPGRYETAYETITLDHSENDEFEIFNKDDRVADYQWYPKDAISSILDLPDAGLRRFYCLTPILQATQLLHPRQSMKEYLEWAGGIFSWQLSTR